METQEGGDLCFPQLLNTSCRKPVRPQHEVMLTYVLLSSISLLTTALNLAVIVSIAHFKQLHTPTNFLLLSLAVSDFFVGLLMFFQIILLDGCWIFGDAMCSLYVVLDYTITSSSIGTMVLISVDRYVAICYPLHYPTKVTVRGVTVCIGFCWAGAVLYNCLLLSDNLKHPGRYKSCSGECVVVINHFAGLADVILSFIGPVTVIVVLYVKVFAVAVAQAHAMRTHIASVTLQGSVKAGAKKSEAKAAKTLGIVVVVFLLCLCPYFCITLTDTLINLSSAAFVICLFYFNSCLNPLIYALFYPWFRKSVKLILTLQILEPDSCDIRMLS
ncbi:trace amine-associated receptor 13c-like [Nelusetta ayraudi]|uniref:trace amine-associated receptor 13c-like n=1 Tax=Nelusetta ayraudi TaxID=303726 RepID=UPI003F7269C3